MPISNTSPDRSSKNEPRPRVSVCIPTIDRPDLLRQAIQSVAEQSFRDFEIVIGDNSADPDQQRRIDAVLAEFPGLTVVVKRHASRLPPAESFNRLIDAARGELWVCLPDDDLLCPDFLAHSLDALDAHPDCAFTFADHWIIDAEGKRDEAFSRYNTVKFGRDRLRKGVYRHEELLDIAFRQSICLQTTMFRHQAIARLRFVPGLFLLDLALFLRLAMSEEPFHAYYLDERVFDYRIHGAQTTSTTKREELIKDQIAVFESLGPVPASHARQVRHKLGRTYLALALLEAERGAFRDARAHATKGLGLTPRPSAAAEALLIIAAPSLIPAARRLYRRLNPPS